MTMETPTEDVAVEPTVMSEAAERVKAKRSDRKAKLGFQDLSLEVIDHGRNPRIDMGSTDMKGLTESVSRDGVLSPIRVRPEGERFVIVFGHRRFEAAKAAKLATIPAMVTTPADPDVFVQSLVENIQRAELNPLEEAQAYKAIIEETGMTQSELGKRVGKSQPHISNLLRILGMPDSIQAKVATGDLTAAHAKSIAALPEARQKALATEIVKKKMTAGDLQKKLANEHAEQEFQVKQAAQQQTDADKAEALLKSSKVTKKMAVIMDGSAKVVEILNERGWKIQPMDYNKFTSRPTYECTCKAVYVSVWQGTVDKACVVRSHRDEAARAADEIRRAEEATRQAALDEKNKIFEKSQRKALKAIRADGKGLLNLDGQRLLLYNTVVHSRNGALADFQERHGGKVDFPENDFAAVWETVIGLSEEDLGTELSQIIVRAVLDNPFTTNRFNLFYDRSVRAWMIESYGLDRRLLWGDHEPPTDVQLKEAQEVAEQEAAIADAENDPVAYLQATHERHEFVANPDDVDLPEEEQFCEVDGTTKEAHALAWPDAPSGPLGLDDAQPAVAEAGAEAETTVEAAEAAEAAVA